MGLFDWISDKVGNVYDVVKDNIGSFGKTVSQWTSGQFHAPGGYNYCGPGTKLDNAGNPINKVDSACMVHDYEYDALAKNKSKIIQDDFNRMIRESDQKLVDSINRTGQNDLGALMSKWGIKGKMALEDLGILKREKFVG